MGLAKLLAFTAVPAAIGAVASCFTDMSVGEGAKQAFLAGLPMAAVVTAVNREEFINVLDVAGGHKITFPLLVAGLSAAAYYFGGMGIEYMTGKPFDGQFVAAVGAVEGALSGAACSLIGHYVRQL